MIIPFNLINNETLKSMIEECVSREGTDNGYTLSLDSKVNGVISHLKTGALVIVYDAISQTHNIISAKKVTY